jgi:hypothetical protein
MDRPFARQLVLEATASALGRPLNIYEQDLISRSENPLEYVDERYGGDVFIPDRIRSSIAQAFLMEPA